MQKQSQIHSVEKIASEIRNYVKYINIMTHSKLQSLRLIAAPYQV